MLYYAYGHPTSFASNNGYSEAETDLMFFVRDVSGSVSIILVHDKVNNADGGEAHVRVAPHCALTMTS